MSGFVHWALTTPRLGYPVAAWLLTGLLIGLIGALLVGIEPELLGVDLGLVGVGGFLLFYGFSPHLTVVLVGFAGTLLLVAAGAYLAGTAGLNLG